MCRHDCCDLVANLWTTYSNNGVGLRFEFVLLTAPLVHAQQQIHLPVISNSMSEAMMQAAPDVTAAMVYEGGKPVRNDALQSFCLYHYSESVSVETA